MERVACGDDHVEMETLQKLNKAYYIVTVGTGNYISSDHSALMFKYWMGLFSGVLIAMLKVQDQLRNFPHFEDMKCFRPKSWEILI